MSTRFLASSLLAISLLRAATPLIKSTDGGRTWTDIGPGQPHQGVIDLQILANGSRIYALTVTPTGLPATPYSFWPTRGNYNVLSSSDGGRTWQTLEPLRVTAATFAAMAVARSEPETLYVVHEGPHDGLSFLKTSDGGRTAVHWQDSREFSYPPFIPAMWNEVLFLADPAISTNLLVGILCWDCGESGPAFFKSVDGGRAWQRFWSYVNQVLFDPARQDTLYANGQSVSGRSVLKSTDGGSNWVSKLSDPAAIALDPSDTAVLLVSRSDGTLWRSGNGGETWRHLGNWIPFNRLVIHPANPSLVFGESRAFGGQIFKSRDGGESWTAFPSGLDGFSFVFDPGNPEIVYGLQPDRRPSRLRPPHIRNLAGGSALAPGSLFSIYGEDLTGTSVTFNGEPARLLFLSRGQINGQVPAGLRGREAIVEILREPGGLVDRQSITLSPAAPVILPDSSGAVRLYHHDGGRPVTADDPARNGRWIVAYCTGLGDSMPPWVQLLPADKWATPLHLKFVEPVPGLEGVSRVVLDIPPSLPPGSYVLLFSGGQNFARLEVR